MLPMTSTAAELDAFLLERWPDVTAFRDAIKELEDRLEDRLKVVGQRVGPWLAERKFAVLDHEKRHAGINVVRKDWMKNKEEAFICVTISGLYPFGYRRVDEEHPYVWVHAYGLSEDHQERFEVELTERLKGRPEDWINKDCDVDFPAGRYIRSHGDKERAALAQSDDALEAFIKTHAEPLLALGDEIDAALRIARGK